MAEEVPRSQVSVQMMSPDATLRELLQMMLEKQLSHAEIPYGDSMFIHIAIVFGRVESSKLTVHLDGVTLRAISKANEKLRPR